MNEKGTPGNLKPFVKGDPRINRKGRPRDFDGLRKLAKSIAHEGALTKNQEPLIINGNQQTVLQAMLRSWIKGTPAQQMKFVAIAFGEVPQETRLTGKDGGPIQHEDVGLTDEDRAIKLAAIFEAARARRDRQAPDQANDLGAIAGAAE